MTIKEMEEKSGLARANIRFYESEGLLAPERKANGYRDYSKEDLETLLRVRLLRSLGVPLEDIKAIQAGDLPLPEALGRHLDQLTGEQTRLSRAEAVCRQMQEAGEDYAHLDAPKYLEALAQCRPVPAPVPESDALPKVQAPWRRYFARSLDGLIYAAALYGVFLLFGLHHLVDSYSLGPSYFTVPMYLLGILFGLLLTIVLEPPLLHWFGTTPGKALLGLHVRDLDGGKLSYEKAVFRTGGVLFHGFALSIPIVDIVQHIRCYRACTRGQTLPWEEETVLVLRDEKAWRTAVFVAALAAVCFLSVSEYMLAELPANRGEVTVAEFCENFNRQADALNYTRARLEPDGTWRELEKYGMFVLEDEVGPALPALSFTESDGRMTGLTFSLAEEGGDFYMNWGQKEMALALWAFVGAQQECGILHGDLRGRYDDLLDNGIHAFADDLYGVRVRCDAAWEGYPGPVLMGEDGEEAAFSVTFTMEKE